MNFEDFLLYLYLGGGKLEWLFDGFCDDINNNKACDYDGGDCCGENVKKDYCTVCECKGSAMAPCLM